MAWSVRLAHVSGRGDVDENDYNSEEQARTAYENQVLTYSPSNLVTLMLDGSVVESSKGSGTVVYR